jgi:Kef-type K+ transport system membrane component KefB
VTRLQWILVATGTILCSFGVLGSIFGDRTDPVRVAVLIVLAAVTHDLLIVPVVLAAGLVLRRAPDWARAPLQATLLICAVVVLVSVPVLGRFGARADNPSLLPRDYQAGLAVVLGLVLLAAAGLAALRCLRRRRTERDVMEVSS